MATETVVAYKGIVKQARQCNRIIRALGTSVLGLIVPIWSHKTRYTQSHRPFVSYQVNRNITSPGSPLSA
jgi:hypothetical protein